MFVQNRASGRRRWKLTSARTRSREEDDLPATAKQTVHVVFNPSAAASIRQAFAEIGCGERVIGLIDNLSFGPIDLPDAAKRRLWVEDELGYEWDDVAQSADEFWAEAISADVLPVAWVSRLHAPEYAAFLEFAWRKRHTPFRVIDATGLEIPRHDGTGTFVVCSLGILPPYQIIEARLLERQRILAPVEIDNYVEQWRRLKTENAPLRIVDEIGLVSAPITFYDDALIARVSDNWQVGALVIGGTMADLMDNPHNELVSDLLLWARVCALCKAGALELRGDETHMHNAYVRRGVRPADAAGK